VAKPKKKPSMEITPPRKAKSARSGARTGGGGGGGGWRGWLRALARSAVIGTILAGGLVGYVEWRWATRVVDKGLEGPVWTVPGRVTSAPLEWWPGLAATPEELARDLSAAGYARVTKAVQPGDFQVGAEALHVVLKSESGAGYEVKAGEVLVTFRGGRIKSISPSGKLVLPPATLALVRGRDNENRSPVPLERIPETMVNAVLAIEDTRFYQHEGIDPLGIARALFRNAIDGAWTQGGSTLTQQLVKNVFLTHERTAERKWKEALITMAVENRLGKGDILELYLNEIYLGQAGGSSVCGVDAAARAYFGKPVERVTLPEAATIAGMIASPNPYHPVRHPEAAQARRDRVIARMLEVGFIDEAAAKSAGEAALVTHSAPSSRVSPWAVDLAVEEAESGDEGRVARDALSVQTTIQPQLQRLAEKAVSEGAAELVAAHPGLEKVQVAMAVVRARDGAVVAMVGGRDYNSSAFNRVVNSPRPIGSTVKPLTALAAFEADAALSPATLLDDAPIERVVDGKTWAPANYDGQFAGPTALRDVIAKSRNVPAVLLAERVGLDALRSRLRSIGLGGATAYPSVSLGGFSATPGELAAAYTVFAADGAFHEPFLVRAVRDDKATIAENVPQKATVRFSPRATFLARDTMRSVLAEGTGKGASKYGVGQGAAGKTGTTDDYADAWFAGVSGPHSVVVWVGFDQPRSMKLTGGVAALPTWARFVDAAGLDDTVASAPEGLEQVEVCVATGAPPCADCAATRSEWFTVGTVPEAQCSPIEAAAEAVKTGWEKLGEMLGLVR